MRKVVWMETRSWRFSRRPEMQRSGGGSSWRLQGTPTGAAITSEVTAAHEPALTPSHPSLSPLRQLTAVSDLLQSCQTQRLEAESRLSEVEHQVSSVPRLFPWPGLGERRQALEQAQMLLDKMAAMAPVLSDVRKQVK